MSTLMHQAVKPRGAGGVVMGWLLESGDAVQNRATVDALDPPPGAAVLEIGFGPGHALQMLALSHPLGLVAGIDHSELMVARARHRLNGRRGDAALDLRIGDAGNLPFPDEKFDVVFAVNSFHQWPDQAGALAEMAGVLKPGGDLLLSIRDFRVAGRFEPPGNGADTAKIAAEMLKDLGLQVRLREVVHSPARATLLVRGRKCGRAEA
ncbi:class I SAM-dependent methyltransferase [Phenylobacterium sp.]|uniref:class I SAM-dependent methyltransferase n=1 Tax=Phenylobacterium sp. TaxID=1871053 RepID=UPI0025E9FA38|nr:class I SAM-dependent methyltransferase [Phenylobacterium sp.]